MFTDHKSLQYVFTQNKLNLRQRRCLELLKDYDMSVLYHTRKDNVIEDALSRVSMGSVTRVVYDKKQLVKEVYRLALFGVRLEESSKGGGSS